MPFKLQNHEREEGKEVASNLTALKRQHDQAKASVAEKDKLIRKFQVFKPSMKVSKKKKAWNNKKKWQCMRTNYIQTRKTK